MDEQGCPRCKTTKYRNPSLKLMVNVCGHSLCESCVDMLFMKGSGACPECSTALRRNNYRLQVFEDASVEKEMDIRRKILRDFNKKEDDFSNLRDYNDYLEMIETIIFNLTNGVDVETTRKTIDQYKKDNKEYIKKNHTKLSRDEEYLEQLIEQQRMEAVTRKQHQTEEELREKALKRKNKEALIDDLMFSDKAASDILATHKQTMAAMDDQQQPSSSAAITLFSSRFRPEQQSVFDSINVNENVAYQYTPLVLEPCGPSYPDMNEIVSGGFLHNVRGPMESELGGGFMPRIACQRALEDAVCGLLYCPPFPQASPSTFSSSQSHEEGYSPMIVT